MKKQISSGAQKVASAAKARPAETRWSLIGAAAGAALGLVIGGVGVVAMGGGVGIPAAVILAVFGGMLGNRYGVGKDRPV